MGSIVRKLTQFTKKEIDQLWKSAHPALKHDGFLLLKAPSQGDFGRILLVISRKVGTAPVRNKLRRRIKSIFYEHEIYDQEFDWIFFARPAATKLSFQELESLLIGAMQ